MSNPMLREQVIETLRVIGVAEPDLQTQRSDRISISCPLAPFTHQKGVDHRPSMSVWFGDDPHFHCFACHEHGKIWELVDTLGRLRKDGDLVKLADALCAADTPTLSGRLSSAYRNVDDWVRSGKSVPDAKLPLTLLEPLPPVADSPHAADYCRARLWDESVCRDYNLRYDPLYHRVVFPVFNRDKHLVGAQGRYVCLGELPERVQKYYNYYGFSKGLYLGGVDHVPGRPRYVWVVEGFGDLLHCAPFVRAAGDGIVTTFGASVGAVQARKLITLDTTVVVLYDGDTAGNRGWGIAQEQLLGKVYGLKRGVLPSGLDPGDLTGEMFADLRNQITKAL
jgi:DNA primase